MAKSWIDLTQGLSPEAWMQYYGAGRPAPVANPDAAAVVEDETDREEAAEPAQAPSRDPIQELEAQLESIYAPEKSSDESPAQPIATSSPMQEYAIPETDPFSGVEIPESIPLSAMVPSSFTLDGFEFPSTAGQDYFPGNTLPLDVPEWLYKNPPAGYMQRKPGMEGYFPAKPTKWD